MKAIKVPSHEELIRLSFYYKNKNQWNPMPGLFTLIKTEKIFFHLKTMTRKKLLSSVDTISGFQTENN